mgnify:CR=1 FL=1
MHPYSAHDLSVPTQMHKLGSRCAHKIQTSWRNALHKPNVENKTWLCQAIRTYLKQDNLDIRERFKDNIALRLRIDDIDSHVNTI